MRRNPKPTILSNGAEIASQSRKVPIRSYYCSFCWGWHVTSIPKGVRAQEDDERDERLWEEIYAQRKYKLSPIEVDSQIREMLSIIDQLLAKCEAAIWRTDILKAKEIF